MELMLKNLAWLIMLPQLSRIKLFLIRSEQIYSITPSLMEILSLQKVSLTHNNNNGKEDTIKEEEIITIKSLSEIESKMNTLMKLIKDFLGTSKLIELLKLTKTISILSLNGIRFITMIIEELQIQNLKLMVMWIITKNIEMRSRLKDMKMHLVRQKLLTTYRKLIGISDFHQLIKSKKVYELQVQFLEENV